MKKYAIIIICLSVFFGSCSPKVHDKKSHVYVKENKRNAINQEKSTLAYWTLISFGGLVLGYALTQPE